MRVGIRCRRGAPSGRTLPPERDLAWGEGSSVRRAQAWEPRLDGCCVPNVASGVGVGAASRRTPRFGRPGASRPVTQLGILNLVPVRFARQQNLVRPLRNLTSLSLHRVHVTDDELECFLSNSLALEKLHLSICGEIICLKIPCVLQKFSILRVFGCWRLRVIESKATKSLLFTHPWKCKTLTCRHIANQEIKCRIESKGSLLCSF